MSVVRQAPLQLTYDLQLAPPDLHLHNVLPITTVYGIESCAMYSLLHLLHIHIEGEVGTHTV